MLAHALALLGLAIPFADLLLPALVGWCNKDSDYVRFHARSSLGFQASCLIYAVGWLVVLGACYLALEVREHEPLVGLLFFPLAMASLVSLSLVWILAFIFLVLNASVQAHSGVRYRYPLTVRFFK